MNEKYVDYLANYIDKVPFTEKVKIASNKDLLIAYNYASCDYYEGKDYVRESLNVIEKEILQRMEDVKR